MTLPDGPAPRPFTLEEGWRRQRAINDAARQRGVLNTVAEDPPSIFVRYTRPISGNLNATLWNRVGGWSLDAGTPPPGVSFSGVNDNWTLGPGLWSVTMALRVHTTAGSDAILAAASNIASPPTSLFPQAEVGFRGQSNGVWMSMNFPILTTTSDVVNMWVLPSGTVDILNGFVSFEKRG